MPIAFVPGLLQPWLSLSDSRFLPKAHTVLQTQDTPHLGAFSGLGCFIVPRARVLAERPPHANPVTGRCREASWQHQGGHGVPEAASRICQRFCLCRESACQPPSSWGLVFKQVSLDTQKRESRELGVRPTASSWAHRGMPPYPDTVCNIVFCPSQCSETDLERRQPAVEKDG